jgi:hypothetical protein
LEELREEHAHRRLGIATDQMSAWLLRASLKILEYQALPPSLENANSGLTVSIWLASPAPDPATTPSPAITAEPA